MKEVVRKEKMLIYTANLTIKVHTMEVGEDATKVIYFIINHSKIAHPSMSVAPQPKEGLRYHRQILLEDGPEGYFKYRRERETDTNCRYAHQYLLVTRMRIQEITSATNFTKLFLRDALYLKIWGSATFDIAMRILHYVPGNI